MPSTLSGWLAGGLAVSVGAASVAAGVLPLGGPLLAEVADGTPSSALAQYISISGDLGSDANSGCPSDG